MSDPLRDLRDERDKRDLFETVYFFHFSLVSLT
jgi:hypothetical protein